VRAGLADGGGQRGVQADLVLATFAPLLSDRLLAWTLPVRREGQAWLAQEPSWG
jgi:hypothetical protein